MIKKIFKLRKTRSAMLFGLSLIFVFDGGAQTRISAIKAMLFYENTGTFSENVLTEKGFDLWNTNFDYSYSTFVVVEVEGIPQYMKNSKQIELTARYRPFDGITRRMTIRQTQKIRNGAENGKSYAGFWIPDTGCYPVNLTARVVGQKRTLKETIEFGCGE